MRYLCCKSRKNSRKLLLLPHSVVLFVWSLACRAWIWWDCLLFSLFLILIYEWIFKFSPQIRLSTGFCRHTFFQRKSLKNSWEGKKRFAQKRKRNQITVERAESRATYGSQHHSTTVSGFWTFFRCCYCEKQYNDHHQYHHRRRFSGRSHENTRTADFLCFCLNYSVFSLCHAYIHLPQTEQHLRMNGTPHSTKTACLNEWDSPVSLLYVKCDHKTISSTLESVGKCHKEQMIWTSFPLWPVMSEFFVPDDDVDRLIEFIFITAIE